MALIDDRFRKLVAVEEDDPLSRFALPQVLRPWESVALRTGIKPLFSEVVVLPQDASK